MAQRDTHDLHRDGAYTIEHTLGWVLALVALALGAIGLLVGFGVIGGSEGGVNLDDVAGAGAEGASDWLQGALWLLPAISIALLSRTLHSADHHERSVAGEEHDGMFAAEHGAAYIVALVTIAAAALAPLVGFDVFDRGNVAEDGILWGIASIVPAVVTNTLHSVRHHAHVTAVRYVETQPDRDLPPPRRTVAREGR
jgi:hypothetical protein